MRVSLLGLNCVRHCQGPQQLVPSICRLRLGELLHFSVCRSDYLLCLTVAFFFPSTLTRLNNVPLCAPPSPLFSSTVPSAPPQNLTLEVQNSKVSSASIRGMVFVFHCSGNVSAPHSQHSVVSVWEEPEAPPYSTPPTGRRRRSPSLPSVASGMLLEKAPFVTSQMARVHPLMPEKARQWFKLEATNRGLIVLFLFC